MRTTTAMFGSLLCLCAAAAASSAQRAANPRDALVVSTAWLAAHQRDPNLVLLHVGDRGEYDKTHIAGARFVALDDISVSDRSGKGLVLEMPPAEQLRQKLAALGISDNSRIVVYYGSDRVTPATRVIFTLDYAGLGDSASLLDGGMGAWARDGHAVTDAATPAKSGEARLASPQANRRRVRLRAHTHRRPKRLGRRRARDGLLRRRADGRESRHSTQDGSRRRREERALLRDRRRFESIEDR